MRDNGGSGIPLWSEVAYHQREAILATKLHWYPTVFGGKRQAERLLTAEANSERQA
jgi:hypothetical protein